MTPISVYNEVAILIAELNPSKIIDFKPSESSIQRLKDLLEINQNSNLNANETYELDRLLALDHLIALAKAHARIRLKAEMI